VKSWWLDQAAADDLFEQAAKKINWAQKRNAKARKSHTKSKRRKLRQLGIKLTEIKRCRWKSRPT
jgi:hypothetical protein